MRKIVVFVACLVFLSCAVYAVSGAEEQTVVSEKFVNQILSRRMVGAEFYSTNDLENACLGTTGVYAYLHQKKGSIIYLLLDFDEGCIYRYVYGNEGDVVERASIASGDLRSYLHVLYQDGSEEWEDLLWWVAAWNDVPTEYLSAFDHDGEGYTFETMNLEDALGIMLGRPIRDYSGGKPYYVSDAIPAEGLAADSTGEQSDEEAKEYTFDGVRFDEAYGKKTLQSKTGHKTVCLLFDSKNNIVYKVIKVKAHSKTTYELKKGTYTLEGRMRQCTFDDGSMAGYEKVGTYLRPDYAEANDTDSFYNSSDLKAVINDLQRNMK